MGAAAKAVAGAIRAKLAAGGPARVALSGGSALRAWPLAAEALGDALPRLRLTWVDERCVPADDPESNRGSTYRASTARPGAELPLWVDGDSQASAATRVRETLAAWGGALDVTLLGMGGDGHIASLFPGHSWDGEGDGDVVLPIVDSPKPPVQRMTLTRRTLATAKVSILVALGEGKRAALDSLVRANPELPATGLPGLNIFTDLHLNLDLATGSKT